MNNKLATTDAASPTPQSKQLDALRRIAEQATPKGEIRWRETRGGKQRPYTDSAYVIRTLNQAFGWDWDWIVDNEELLFNGERPFEVKVRGRLTVRLGGQAVTKTQFGCQPIEFLRDGSAPVSIGDCFKGAASDALKKCASLLGIALDLYDSDSNVHGGSGHGGNGDSAGAAFDPKPKTLGDLVTPKQLWMIRNMARETGVDIETECKTQFNCELEEISKRAASMLIEQLKKYSEGQAAATAPANPSSNAKGDDGGREKAKAVKGAAGQILALADALKWTASQIADEIQVRAGFAIDPNALADGISAMPETDQQKLIHALKLELQSRAQTSNHQTTKGKQR